MLHEVLSKIYLRLLSLRRASRMASRAEENYPFSEIIDRAKRGEESIYPFTDYETYGRALLGADVYSRPTIYPLLDRIMLVPPAFTPLRLKKMGELLREPTYMDVDLECTIGGYRSSMPLAVSSMGSTTVMNKVAPAIARASAKAGIPMGIGENVATMWGYAKRVKENHPCFKERVMNYLENMREGMGGIYIQQSVEDAFDELWNKTYSDPDITPYIEKGQVGFEIKIGQGAKPGLGGEVKVSREEALRLMRKYHFADDPQRGLKEMYERHSAPGTFIAEILRSMIRLMRNNYPKCKIWVKVGPYRDLEDVLEVLIGERVDAITIDGKEGGTGMSPVAALKHLGLPLTSMISKAIKARQRLGGPSSILVSGRLYDGGHLVKCCCLGLNGVSMGRPIVIAAHVGGERGVLNYLRTLEIESKMLVSALGKYKISELSCEDVMALDRDLAEALGIRYIFG